MSRIPPEEIERLKREIPIQRLVEARGIKLKPHGKDLIGLCNFHNDHSPSLVISTEKNLWNCLGACGTGGTVFDWVMKAEGVDFLQAVEILREGANLPSLAFPIKPYKKPSTVPKLSPPVDFNAEDRELLGQTIEYYHQTLKQSPEALSYLEKRGLKNPEMIDHFKLGYVNRTFGFRLPEKNRKTGAAIRERLTDLGIFRKSGHECFNGCVIVPIFDEHNHVTGIYGRKIHNEQRADAIRHLYLVGPHKGVWNIEALKTGKEIILCEALIDALTFWNAGFHNVTASYGVNGFTLDHWEAFKKHGIERVFIAYDNDEAGNKAAEKLSMELLSEGFECSRILFPRGMDVNEYALKVKPSEKSLALVFHNATRLGKGECDAVQIPEIQEKEPKAATKGENILEEPQGLEVLSQPLKETTDIFPLDAKKPDDEPPKPEPALNAPVSQPPELVAEVRGEEIFIQLENRCWRVRGLAKNTNHDQLKVNLRLSKDGSYFLDTLDLCTARSRILFQKQASEELKISEDVIKSDLGKLLVKLEELQAKQLKEAPEPKKKEVVLTSEEKVEALELLKDPNFLNRIQSDFVKCGIVGEETNKLVGYLAGVSRKLLAPLGIIIQSSSAAGKSSLMEAVLAFTPEEERVKYSAMTGQSLFYMGETNLRHKILAIVEEAGAEKASYAMKLLQSEGELTIASTGKDPVTGRLITNEYRVEGPVMLFVTTTKVDVDEELQNRCIMLAVDESREQTRAIHRIQREKRTLAGLHAKDERDKILRVHRNAQRLLMPIKIVNHYARELTFLEDKIRLRRDHEKYLNLIEAITFIQQFQRPVKIDRKNGKETPFLEVTFEDIEIANRLADEVLGRSLDEIPPQTRKLLLMIETMVLEACQKLNQEQCEYRFTRRTVREYSGWGNTQLKLHLHRLEEFEYLIPHRGSRGQNFVYELIYDGKGKDGKPFLSGLINVEKLRSKYGYVSNKSGVNDEKSGPSRPHVGLKSPPSRVSNSPEDQQQESVSPDKLKNVEKHIDTGILDSPPNIPIGRTYPYVSFTHKGKKGFCFRN